MIFRIAIGGFFQQFNGSDFFKAREAKNYAKFSWRILNNKIYLQSMSGFSREYSFPRNNARRVDVLMCAIVHLPSGP